MYRGSQAYISRRVRRAATNQNAKPKAEFTAVVDIMNRLFRSSESRARPGPPSARRRCLGPGRRLSLVRTVEAVNGLC